MYFTTGLQIFVVQIPVELRYSNIPSSSQFETRFHSTWWSYSLVFKEIEVDTDEFSAKSRTLQTDNHYGRSLRA
jgi:hypothetical protein